MRANGAHMGCCASGSKHVSEYRRSQVEKDHTELSLGSYLLRHEQTGKTIQALYRSTACSNNVILCHSRRRYELHKKTPLSPDDGFKTFGGNFFFLLWNFVVLHLSRTLLETKPVVKHKNTQNIQHAFFHILFFKVYVREFLLKLLYG